MGSDESMQGNTSGLKRQRVALACNPCRTRKSRCNGARPRCDLCERMSFECTYDAPGSAANVIIPKDAFNDIESRLALLEEAVKRHNDQLSARGSISVASVEDSKISIADVVTTVEQEEEEHSHGQEPDDHTDGMAISFVDEKDQGFYGPSANISFMRIILRCIVATTAQNHNNPNNNHSHNTVNHSMNSNNNTPATAIVNIRKPLPPTQKPPPLLSPSTNPAILPPDSVTERLLHEYFANTGMLFPYLHEATFMQTYRHARSTGFTGVRRTWLALLNILLAMATRADASSRSPPEDNSASPGGTVPLSAYNAELFFQRARTLCGSHILRGTTLETVQYLLLSTQYLQGTQHAVQTWTSHGLAVKAALSIGLHSKMANSNPKLSPVEREMRKRTWYGCIVLDRSLSMTFGRPAAVPEDYVRLELPIPLVGEGERGDKENGMSARFFAATCSLYRILWMVIRDVYGSNIESEELGGSELMGRIVKLEGELDGWRGGLPPGLSLRASYCSNSPGMGSGGGNTGTGGAGGIAGFQFHAAVSPEAVVGDGVSPSSLFSAGSTGSMSAQVDKLRNILTLRYLNTKLLLLRPILTNLLNQRFLSHGSGNSDSSGLGGAQQLTALSTSSPGRRHSSFTHSALRSTTSNSSSSLGYMQNNYFTAASFRAAVETIAIIHAAVTRAEEGRHMLGAWWFTLCYAFNASLTVFGILLLLPPIPPQNTQQQTHDDHQPYQDQGRQCLQKAIEALSALAPPHSSSDDQPSQHGVGGHNSSNALVDRCVEQLRQLILIIDNRRAASAAPVRASSTSTPPPAPPSSALSPTLTRTIPRNFPPTSPVPPFINTFGIHDPALPFTVGNNNPPGPTISSSSATGGGGGLSAGAEGSSSAVNYDFMNMDENSILGMSFPDYYQSMFMFEDEMSAAGAGAGSGQGGGIGGGFTFGGDNTHATGLGEGGSGGAGGSGSGGGSGFWSDYGYSI